MEDEYLYKEAFKAIKQIEAIKKLIECYSFNVVDPNNTRREISVIGVEDIETILEEYKNVENQLLL